MVELVTTILCACGLWSVGVVTVCQFDSNSNFNPRGCHCRTWVFVLLFWFLLFRLLKLLLLSAVFEIRTSFSYLLTFIGEHLDFTFTVWTIPVKLKGFKKVRTNCSKWQLFVSFCVFCLIVSRNGRLKCKFSFRVLSYLKWQNSSVLFFLFEIFMLLRNGLLYCGIILLS